MEKLGIIGAMEEEVSLLKEMMETPQVKKIAGLEYFSGKIHQMDCVVVRSGIGKVNAAMCTQILVDYFAPTKIVNIGVAGALAEDLNIGDMIISKDLIQHDMDVTGFGEPRGVIPRMDNWIFTGDDSLVKLALASGEALGDTMVRPGRILSGDVFVSSLAQKEDLITTFQGDCAEMEGAAIGHVCYLNKVPFVVIRSMSDKANGEAVSNFAAFEHEAALNAKKLMIEMIQRMS